jgi:hypothetical protein
MRPWALYAGRNEDESSRLRPKVVCVRSLVPKEKKSAWLAMSPATTQACEIARSARIN